MKTFFRLSLLSFFLSLSAAFSGCRPRSEAPAMMQEAMKVPVSHPIEARIVDWDEYTGRFQAAEEVQIRARVSGYVESVQFADGQMVKEGDVLYVIDQRPFKIALERAKAQLRQAQAEYQQAINDFERAKQLKESLAISGEELDKRQQSMYALAAQSDAAEAAVSEAELDLEFTEVKAPLDGRVGRNLVDRGNLISGGMAEATLLTTVVSLAPIDFYFEVSEADILKYNRMDQNGSRPDSRTSSAPVFVKLLDEAEYLHEGTLDFVDNVLDTGTGTIQLRASFANSDHLIDSGMFGRARLVGSGEYQAILVPEDIVGINQSQKFVYVIGDNNTLEARPVKTGALYQDKFRVIREGITAADQVVTGNIQKIRAVIPVEPVLAEMIRPEKRPTP